MTPDIDAIMKGSAPKPDEDHGHMMDLEECMQDFMDAKSAKDKAMALKDFISLCGKNPPDMG
jgi:hypothetical protein